MTEEEVVVVSETAKVMEMAKATVTATATATAMGAALRAAAEDILEGVWGSQVEAAVNLPADARPAVARADEAEQDEAEEQAERTDWVPWSRLRAEARSRSSLSSARTDCRCSTEAKKKIRPPLRVAALRHNRLPSLVDLCPRSFSRWRQSALNPHPAATFGRIASSPADCIRYIPMSFGAPAWFLPANPVAVLPTPLLADLDEPGGRSNDWVGAKTATRTARQERHG